MKGLHMTQDEYDELMARRKPKAAVAAPGPRQVAARVETGQEAAFQRDAEAWLVHRGYWPRTPKRIAAGPPPMGWYIHLPKAKGNPLILDLLIIHNDGRWLEIELKTGEGRLLNHQRQLVEQDPWKRPVCRSMDELRSAVEAWEDWK